jgi:hypothetical protein
MLRATIRNRSRPTRRLVTAIHWDKIDVAVDQQDRLSPRVDSAPAVLCGRVSPNLD